MNLGVLLGRAAFGAVVLRAAGVGLAWLLNVYFARILDPTAYGIFAIAMSALAVVSVLAKRGLDIGGLRFVSVAADEGDLGLARAYLRYASLSATRVSILLAAAAVAVFATPVGPMITPRSVLYVTAAILPAAALLRLYEGTLRGLGAVVDALLPYFVLVPVVAIGVQAALLGAGNEATALSALGAYAVGVLLALAWALRTIFRRLSGARTAQPDRALVRHWSTVASQLTVYAFFGTALAQADTVVVGWLAGADDAAVYYAASKTAAVLALFGFASNFAVGPHIAQRFAAGEAAWIAEMLARLRRWLVPAALTMLVAVVVAGRWVLGLFGDEYVVGYAALLLCAGGQAVNLAMGPVVLTLNMIGRETISVRWMAVASVVAVGGSVLLVPLMGIEGAALSTTAGYVIANCGAAWSVRRLLKGAEVA